MKLIITFFAFISASAFAADFGTCHISAFSDTAATNSQPRKFFNRYVGKTTAVKCSEFFENDVNNLKNCGVIVGRIIQYAEMRFTMNDSTFSAVEEIGVDCAKN